MDGATITITLLIAIRQLTQSILTVMENTFSRPASYYIPKEYVQGVANTIIPFMQTGRGSWKMKTSKDKMSKYDIGACILVVIGWLLWLISPAISAPQQSVINERFIIWLLGAIFVLLLGRK